MTLPDRDYARWILEGLCIAALMILVSTMLGCAHRQRVHACELYLEIADREARERAELRELWGQAGMADEGMTSE